MIKIKGTVLSSAVDYVLKHFGEEELLAVKGNMDPVSRVTLSESILASQWYPIEALRNIHQILASRHKDNPDIHRQMGRFSADTGLTTVYRMFLKVGKLGYIIGKVSTVWQIYYSRGKMEVVDRGDKRVRVGVSDFPHLPDYFCRRLLGYMERVGELSGEDVVAARVEDRTKDSCCFYFEWA